VTEVRMGASRCDDEEIIAMRKPADIDAPALEVYPARLPEQYGDIALTAQDVPQRGGDGGRGDTGGRDLIEQRLKGVVIAAIDQQEVGGGGTQGAHGGEPPEAAANDDDPWPRMHRRNLSAIG
jgi:hypothetical protein